MVGHGTRASTEGGVQEVLADDGVAFVLVGNIEACWACDGAFGVDVLFVSYILFTSAQRG